MTYKTAKRVELSKNQWVFSWGYVDNVSEVDKQPYFASYIRNGRLEWQSIIIRPGHDLLASLTAGSPPKGIWTTSSLMVIRHNVDSTHKLVTVDTSWSVTDILTNSDIASDNRMRFVNVWDVVYCMNWSDLYGKLSWTTYTEPTTWIASFAPSFGVVFNSCMRVSWFSGDVKKVYKSVADSYEDFNGAGSDNFTFQENITGLASNGQSIFYFTPKTISVTASTDVVDTAGTVSYKTSPITVEEWAVNHDSIAVNWYEVFYLTPSNAICMITRWQAINWFESKPVSNREYAGISKFLQSLPLNQTNAFAILYPKENLIKWFLYNYGDTFPTVCVCYDTVGDKFTIDSNKFFFWGVQLQGLNYTISAIEPKVYRDEYGQTDEDSPIPFEYWTTNFYLWDNDRKKIIRETKTLVDINELAELEQQIWLNWWLADTKTIDSDNIPIMSDWIGTEEIWTFPIGIDGDDTMDLINDWYNEVPILRTKWSLGKKCNKIQFRFINNSSAGKVRLKSIQVKVEYLPDEANNLTA